MDVRLSSFLSKPISCPSIVICRWTSAESLNDLCSSLEDRYSRSVIFMANNSIGNGCVSNFFNWLYKSLSISLVRSLRTETESEKFTLGLSLRDTTQLQGYFYTITSSRTPEVKAFFPVDKSAFRAANISAARALAHSDIAGQIYYVLVYNDKPVKEKFHATVAKIYRSDGLAWKTDYPLSFTPSELIVSAGTGELVIRNGAQQVVIDKNGKVVR